MKRLTAVTVMVLSALLSFPAFLPQSQSADVTPYGAPPAGGEGAPPSGGARAEPDFCGTGLHSRWASYDFSNTYMFTRWAVVMETGKATLMKDISFQNDKWVSRAALPAGQNRSWHVAVYDDTDNLVIVQGGYCWEAGMTGPVYCQPLCTYDPVSDMWTERGPSKLPQKATGVWDSSDRCLIVCGGSEVTGGNTVVHNETWAWFPSNGSWLRLADMPAARFGQCSAYDPVDGLMLVFGGTNGPDVFNDVWAYDPGNDKWTVLAPEADEYPLVREYSSAVWNPQKREMLIYGGENPNVTFLSTWAYSYANNTWIHRTGHSWALSMQGACFIGDRGLMTVFGGRWHPGNLQYDYYNNTWTYDAESDSYAAAANAPIPGPARAGAAAVYDPVRKRALVIGGSDQGGFCQNDTWAFTPGPMQWSYYTPGFMEAPAVDLGENFSSLDKVSWTADLPAGTAVSLRLRTSTDNISFGSLVSVANGARPAQQGRYVGWNMSLSASLDALSAPVIRKVRFDYTVNMRPSCSGGENLTASKRQAVTLNGSALDPDGDALAYRWVKLSPLDGVFDDATKKDAAYTPLAAGKHMLQLVVNDSFGETAAPYITVTAINNRPTASAGPDRTCFKMETVTFEGTASDPDGDHLFYNWTQPSGAKLAIASPISLRPSVTPAKAGNYSFQLKADDGEFSVLCTVNLTVFSRPPTARLDASPATLNINGRVNFSAARSEDSDGNLTRYLFDFGDGNDTGWTARPDISYVYTRPGVFNATLMVQDDDGNLSAPSVAVKIIVSNALPVIDAAVVPSTGNISTSFRFSLGSDSHDPDGRIVSADWSFGDGASASGNTVAHSYSRRGVFNVVLKATDDFGGVSETNLTLSVVNRAPVIQSATPVAPLKLYTGGSAVFSVSARDPDGDGLNCTWTVNGKASGGNQASFTYKPSLAGTTVISVSVSDGEENLTHEWMVTVKEPVSGPSSDAFMLAGIAFVAVLVGVIAVVAVRRRRPA